MSAPYSSSSARAPQGPFHGTHRQDFKSHVDGGAFRHDASMVDMHPILPGFSATNVETTLQQMQSLISSSGSGFISIGILDGYEGSLGSYNVGAVGTPTLAAAFAAAVSDKRLKNGGVIFLMSNTYHTSVTINVPQGITVMGEPNGTYIVGNMSEASIFKVAPTNTPLIIGVNSGGSDVEPITGTNVGRCRFFNFTIIDNDGYQGSGNNSTMTTVPMVSVQNGASAEFEHVTFLGRLNTGVALNRVKTQAAIGTIAGGGHATTIIVKDCYIDGVKWGINFATGLGDKDFITVSGTRGRWYGKEGAAFDSINDAFINATLCNLQINNSYLVGGGANTLTIANFNATGGSTNVRVGVSNLLGSPGTANVGSSIITNLSGVTFRTGLSGNAWGDAASSTWYIVVGGTAGTYPSGDLFGASAIDTILSMTHFKGTVVVNPGTYTVTGTAASATNFTNLKFIGNKNGTSYPIFNMALTAAGNDQIGNKFLVVGNHIEGIYFNGNGAVNSIRPSFNATSNTTQDFTQTLTVKDCVFNDVSLNLLPMNGSAVDVEGKVTGSIIKIQDCYFNQTGTFNESVSFLSPASDIIDMTNCLFRGKGYYIVVGFGGGEPTLARGILSMDRVVCDATGTTLTNSHPLGGGVNSHVYVNTTNISTVNLNKCEFLTSNNLACVSTLVGGTLASSGTYSRFIQITSANVNINACTFNGPNQTFTSAAVDYPMQTLALLPSNSCKVTNSHFVGGGVLLAIITNLANTSLKENVVIDGNNFVGGSTITNSNSQTLLDIDCDCAASTTTTIFVTNNTFKSSNGSNPIQPRHVNVTGATYNSNGIVQIYSRGVNVVASGNHIRGQLTTPTINPFNHFSGLVINTYTSPSGATALLTSATVMDNNISIQSNSFHSGTATQSATCLKVFTTVANISGNNLNMRNVTVDASIAGCIYSDTRLVGTSGTLIISENILGRADDNGTLHSIVGGYITVSATSDTGGIVTNNSFDSPTLDGASTILTQFLNATPNWIYTQNKNQTVVAKVYPSVGTLGIKNGGFMVVAGVAPNVTASYLTSGSALNFNYKDHTTTETINWLVPLPSILPPNVQLISASIDVSCTPASGAIKQADMVFFNKSLGAGASTFITLTTSPATLTNSTTGYGSDATQGAFISFDIILQHATLDVVATTTEMTITYRW